MHVLVCLKRVPELAEAELTPAADGKSIRTEGLIWELNEWDAYALEWALRLVEEAGGSVTALSLGGEDDEEVLFRALAMGAEQAVRFDFSDEGWRDPAATARALAEAVGEIEPDLVLTGVQSADLGEGQIGVRLAGELGWPYASLVVGLEEIKDGSLVLRRELEGGWEEKIEIDLPAVLTIQSNPNPPRYVSVLGIRKARKKPLTVKPAAWPGPGAMSLESLARIERERRVEFLSQNPDEAAEALAKIIQERV